MVTNQGKPFWRLRKGGRIKPLRRVLAKARYADAPQGVPVDLGFQARRTRGVWALCDTSRTCAPGRLPTATTLRSRRRSLNRQCSGSGRSSSGKPADVQAPATVSERNGAGLVDGERFALRPQGVGRRQTAEGRRVRIKLCASEKAVEPESIPETTAEAGCCWRRTRITDVSSLI